MDKQKEIAEFLDSNIKLFLNDILELPPKERAKAFLVLMARNSSSGAAIVEPKQDRTLEEIEARIAKLKAMNDKVW